MTRRNEEFEQPLGDEHYKTRHQSWPKSLAEQDAEWDRQERIHAQAEERAQRRQDPAC